MKTYSFESLKVWQTSKDLATIVYEITRNFPADAYSGVTDPLYPVSLTPTDEALLVRIKDLLITEHFCSGRGCW
jgi:hypothetical protein